MAKMNNQEDKSIHRGLYYGTIVFLIILTANIPNLNLTTAILIVIIGTLISIMEILYLNKSKQEIKNEKTNN